MQRQDAIIYVAGNPDLYPVEYYDPESESFQGAVPAFLTEFAAEYGYDLRYLQPGMEDRRTERAENQQVDLISGCETGDRFAHTAGEPVVLRAPFPGDDGVYHRVRRRPPGSGGGEGAHPGAGGEPALPGRCAPRLSEPGGGASGDEHADLL